MSSCEFCSNFEPVKKNSRCVEPRIIYVEPDDFDKFLKYQRIASNHQDKFEERVTSFIRSEWNTELDLCVELEDIGLLTIFVGEEVDKVSFYQFVIKPLCSRYALRLAYTETVEGDGNYVEYGLRKINQNALK